MHIITLTTDFGLQDYYVPVLKGAMLSRHQDLNFVDISHNINNHDIVQAAFILKNAWHHFPKGSIHVVSVNNFGGEQERFLIFQHQDHYFIGPDNGIFSLVLDNATPPQYNAQSIYQIPFKGLNFQQVLSVIAEAVGRIVTNEPLSEIGSFAENIVQRITFQPVTTPNQIRGTIIHIDNYDNCILNISRTLFEKVGHGRSFQLYFKRHEPITRLMQHYNEVGIGETLCIFNSDYLEIAINMGKASEMLGLKVEDTVQIDFQV
jgi:S-adenosyl-L-methionine hydrolase (adenosine-forming)